VFSRFSLDYCSCVVCFYCVRFSFLQYAEIGWEERLQDDLCCVELDVKPYFSGAVNLLDMRRLLISLKRKFDVLFFQVFHFDGTDAR